MRSFVAAVIIGIVLLLQPPAAYFVAPYGVSTAAGDADAPRTLAWALASAPSGSTVWVIPGVYSGAFVASAPGVTYRSLPGTRAKLDGKLDIIGAYTTWRDIELTYTGWVTRTSQYAGSAPPDIPNTALYIVGPGTRIEHSIIHDLSDVGWWQPATDSAFVDTLIYNIGWQAPDRGHGHGLYTQNHPTGTKLIKDVISWGNYSLCGKIYGGIANLKNYTVDGLVCGPSGDPRFLVGSETGKADNITIRNSLFFGTSLELSNYGATPATGAITVTDSVIAAPEAIPLTTAYFKGITFTNNTVIGGNGGDPSNRVILKTANRQPGWAFTDNAYTYTGVNPKEVREESVGDRTFAEWQGLGMDAGSAITRTLPLTNTVIIKPTRAHHGQVVIYNWTQAASVTVDLSALDLTPGASYKLTNAQNPDEALPFVAGSPVSLAMSGWTTATPYGSSAPTVPWDSRFGVWLVEP